MQTNDKTVIFAYSEQPIITHFSTEMKVIWGRCYIVSLADVKSAIVAVTQIYMFILTMTLKIDMILSILSLLLKKAVIQIPSYKCKFINTPTHRRTQGRLNAWARWAVSRDPTSSTLNYAVNRETQFYTKLNILNFASDFVP